MKKLSDFPQWVDARTKLDHVKQVDADNEQTIDNCWNWINSTHKGNAQSQLDHVAQKLADGDRLETLDLSAMHRDTLQDCYKKRPAFKRAMEIATQKLKSETRTASRTICDEERPEQKKRVRRLFNLLKEAAALSCKEDDVQYEMQCNDVICGSGYYIGAGFTGVMRGQLAEWVKERIEEGLLTTADLDGLESRETPPRGW